MSCGKDGGGMPDDEAFNAAAAASAATAGLGTLGERGWDGNVGVFKDGAFSAAAAAIAAIAGLVLAASANAGLMARSWLRRALGFPKKYRIQ